MKRYYIDRYVLRKYGMVKPVNDIVTSGKYIRSSKAMQIQTNNKTRHGFTSTQKDYALFTKMNDKIYMDRSIAGSVNVLS